MKSLPNAIQAGKLQGQEQKPHFMSLRQYPFSVTALSLGGIVPVLFFLL